MKHFVNPIQRDYWDKDSLKVLHEDMYRNLAPASNYMMTLINSAIDSMKIAESPLLEKDSHKDAMNDVMKRLKHLQRHVSHIRSEYTEYKLNHPTK